MTGEGPLRSRLPPVFESLASLYGPADPGFQTLIVDAGRSMGAAAAPRARDRRPAVGPARPERAPLHGRDPVRGDAGNSRSCECGRVRPAASDSPSFIGCHRSRVRGASGRPSARTALGGVLVELVRGDRPQRVVDAVALAAGAPSIGRGLRPSGDGSALGAARPRRRRARRAAGLPGRTYQGSGPWSGGAPRPCRGGRPPGPETAPWRHDGRGGLGDRVGPDRGARAAVDSRPRSTRSPVSSRRCRPGPPGRRAVDDQLAEVADVFPEHGAALRAVAAAGARWGTSLPPVLIHGDLWLNNVFVDGRTAERRVRLGYLASRGPARNGHAHPAGGRDPLAAGPGYRAALRRWLLALRRGHRRLPSLLRGAQPAVPGYGRARGDRGRLVGEPYRRDRSTGRGASSTTRPGRDATSRTSSRRSSSSSGSWAERSGAARHPGQEWWGGAHAHRELVGRWS